MLLLLSCVFSWAFRGIHHPGYRFATSIGALRRFNCSVRYWNVDRAENWFDSFVSRYWYWNWSAFRGIHHPGYRFATSISTLFRFNCSVRYWNVDRAENWFDSFVSRYWYWNWSAFRGIHHPGYRFATSISTLFRFNCSVRYWNVDRTENWFDSFVSRYRYWNWSAFRGIHSQG